MPNIREDLNEFLRLDNIILDNFDDSIVVHIVFSMEMVFVMTIDKHVHKIAET